MDPASTASPTRPAMSERVQLGLGKLQHRALSYGLSRAVGLRRGQAELSLDQPASGPDFGPVFVPYLHRGLPYGMTGGVASGLDRRSTDGPRRHAPGLADSSRRPAVPLLFVHGFGGSKETWLMMTTPLARRRPLLVPDLPGFGEASPIPGPMSTARAQAHALTMLLDTLDIERVDLLGTSMGGGIALRLAHDQPARIRSLTLINSIGPEVERSDYSHALDQGENMLIPETPAMVERMLELALARPPKLPRSLMRYAAAQRVAARERLQLVFDAWKSSSPEHGLPDVLAHIDMPALVLAGARDRVVHPATSRALAERLPRAELLMLDGVGHMPQLEAPLATARAVERFLSALDRGWGTSNPLGPPGPSGRAA